MTKPDNLKACRCGKSNGECRLARKTTRSGCYVICNECVARSSYKSNRIDADKDWNERNSTPDPMLAELVGLLGECLFPVKSAITHFRLQKDVFIDLHSRIKEILSDLEPETKGGQDG